VAEFVLVPGGWYGGWVFEGVERPLLESGHIVRSVTLSGLGEQAAPTANLSTHVATLMTMLPDRSVGVAVFTNGNGLVLEILANYVFDRACGKEPIPWLRHRERRRKFVAQRDVDRQARNATRRLNTRPSHDLADYAGDYDHPGYGWTTIALGEGKLLWTYRGMSEPVAHRH
jgi:Domain of unknown function (DUF3471)